MKVNHNYATFLCARDRAQGLGVSGNRSPVRRSNYGKDWAWLCTNKTLLTKTSGGPGLAHSHSQPPSTAEIKGEAGVVVHTCNPSRRDAEAGGSGVQGQPGPHFDTLPQKDNNKQRVCSLCSQLETVWLKTGHPDFDLDFADLTVVLLPPSTGDGLRSY
jgi:hypothetical protein